MSDRADTLARKLIDARAEHARLDKQTSEAYKRMKAIEADFWQTLQDRDGKVKAIDLDLGEGYGRVRFTRRETIFAQIVDPTALARAAREAGRDDELIKQADEAARKSDFRQAPLNELVREALEHDQDLLDGLSFRTDRGITITRKG